MTKKKTLQKANNLHASVSIAVDEGVTKAEKTLQLYAEP